MLPSLQSNIRLSPFDDPSPVNVPNSGAGGFVHPFSEMYYQDRQ